MTNKMSSDDILNLSTTISLSDRLTKLRRTNIWGHVELAW